MIELTLARIAEVVGGELQGFGTILVTGSIETDSRLVRAGALFIAKPGEVTDGHLFIAAAAKSGAVAALVERFTDDDLPQIRVSSVVSALGLLAKFVLAEIRRDGQLQVIGITGSNGKTTTKNMLREILSQQGETIAPIESYNNEVGAPYSMLQATRNTKFLVVELGAGGPGSIDYLAQICQPNIGVILKVGLAHVGEFGGIESTAEIKAELAKALTVGDQLILNADDGYVADMAEMSSAQVHWFGTAPDAEYRATNQSVSINGTKFDLHWPDGETSQIGLQIIGEHHVMNALAASAVASQLGVPRAAIIGALESMPLAERWRMQVTHRPDGITVINDAYNASPESTRAALQSLAQLGKSGRRTIAVLGEMAELGAQSREQHDAIGRVVVRLNIDQLVVVGQNAKLIHMGAEQEGSWGGESKFFESIDEALQYLRGMLVSGDIVLVKSSKSANLRYLGDDLLEVNK